MILTINIKELAEGLADDLQLTDGDIKTLKNGGVPYCWSNSLLDRLEADYSLETLLTTELTKEQ